MWLKHRRTLFPHMYCWAYFLKYCSRNVVFWLCHCQFLFLRVQSFLNISSHQLESPATSSAVHRHLFSFFLIASFFSANFCICLSDCFCFYAVFINWSERSTVFQLQDFTVLRLQFLCYWLLLSCIYVSRFGDSGSFKRSLLDWSQGFSRLLLSVKLVYNPAK